MKVVINRRFGGFGLSDAAYLRLIDLGIPVRKYIEQERSEETGLWLPETRNDGEVIFDSALSDDEGNALGRRQLSKLTGTRFSDHWIRERGRSHPLVVQAVESLGSEVASGRFASLKVIEVPDGTEFEIDDYDGMESIHEKHRSWE